MAWGAQDAVRKSTGFRRLGVSWGASLASSAQVLCVSAQISGTEFWVKQKRIALLLHQAKGATVGQCPQNCVPLGESSWYAQVAKSPNDHQGADVRCKSKRVFITKLKLGLSPLPTQLLWGGAPSLGLHCLHRVYSCKRGFSDWRTSDWSPSFEGLCFDF